jgi:hypothetical protein
VLELHHSAAARAVVCERCHCQAAPQTTAAAWRYRPPRPTRPPNPSRYAQLHTRVWNRLALEGSVLILDVGHIVATCPVCGAGLISVRFLNTDPPRIRTRGCTDGCTDQLVLEQL